MSRIEDTVPRGRYSSRPYSRERSRGRYLGGGILGGRYSIVGVLGGGGIPGGRYSIRSGIQSDSIQVSDNSHASL